MIMQCTAACRQARYPFTSAAEVAVTNVSGFLKHGRRTVRWCSSWAPFRPPLGNKGTRSPPNRSRAGPAVNGVHQDLSCRELGVTHKDSLTPGSSAHS